MIDLTDNESQLPPSDRRDAPDLPEPMLDEGAGDLTTLSINISGNIVTTSTAHLPEDQKLLVRWLFSWAMDNKLTWGQLEAKAGIDRSTLHRVFKGKYLYPTRSFKGGEQIVHPKAGLPIRLDGICLKIAKLKGRTEKVETKLSVGFLETSTWRTMEWACGQAAKKNKPVFVYSDAQIGKTEAAREYAHQHNSGITTYIRIPPTGGVRSLLVAFAVALHLNPKRPYDELRQDIIEALDKSKLLILDEIHEIFITSSGKTAIRLLEEIRYIWDQTHCGMVLIGTNVFRDSFEEAEFKKFLSQWKRRGLYEINLPAITPDADLAIALASYGLPFTPVDDKPFKLALPEIKGANLEQDVRQLTKDGFGQIMTRLEDGKGVAEKAGHAYSWADFITARNIVRKMAML